MSPRQIRVRQVSHLPACRPENGFRAMAEEREKIHLPSHNRARVKSESESADRVSGQRYSSPTSNKDGESMASGKLSAFIEILFFNL